MLSAPSVPSASPRLAAEPDGQTPRAYPIRYLMWHEIVNDRIGTTPVAVTFCSLCNSGPTSDRRIDGRTLSFGVSGKLRNSDMIMYDRETQSWWQQAMGTGIAGAMTGAELTQLPAWNGKLGRIPQPQPAGPCHDRTRHAPRLRCQHRSRLCQRALTPSGAKDAG